MRDLIKNIIRENVVRPQWVKEWDALTKEERIEKLEKKKKQIQKLIPKIVEFFENKFGDNLIKIEVGEQKVYMGNESYSMTKPLISFFFEGASAGVRREIFNDLESFFNLDITLYVVPLEVKMYQMEWKEF